MMTVEEALAYADDASNIWGPKDASRVLAAEVRRLRAAVEAVRALPRDRFDFIDRDDVIAALEATDGYGSTLRLMAGGAPLGNGWIPVGERLPEEFIRVLCRLVIGEGRTEGGWAVGSYAAEFGWMTDGIPPQERSHYAVTHWMALPPLPVAEVKE